MGRPSVEEGSAETELVRLPGDLAEMIRWIIRVEGGSAAQLVGPMIRAQIVARHTKHLATIEKMKAARKINEKEE